MYFHSVHGKNIQLSSDSSQARRISGFCQGITFSNNPLTPLQRVTFLVGNNVVAVPTSSSNHMPINLKHAKKTTSSSKKSIWNGHLRIGLTTNNPVTLTLSDLPEFSYPSLLNTEGFWITCIKSSYLKHGNKLSLVLDEKNSLQLAVNYVVKATLFGNEIIPMTPNMKLWLLLDIYGSTNIVQFLASDDTPYEIKQRGLDAVNNFHSACLIGGSRSIYKTRLFVLGQDDAGISSLKNAFISKNNNNKKATSKNSNKQQQKIDTMASFRVKIDNATSSWIVKPLLASDYKSERRNIKKLSSNKNVSYQSSVLGAGVGGLDKKKSISENNLLEEIRQKKRSTSTSYLNEEDDYDNNFCSKEDLRTFRRKLSLEDNLGKLSLNRRAALEQEINEENSIKPSEENTAENVNDSLMNSQISNYDVKKNGENGQDNNSSSSSVESSDTEYDSDNTDDLYAIDEYDECISTIDCDPIELKKDPTGYNYKRIAFNIFQELFTTKLYDKLWPSTSSSTNSNSPIKNVSNYIDSVNTPPIIGNNFSESFFEKFALMEFEASIYQQLKNAKILYLYYEQIVYNEMKLLKNKQTNMIIVSPVKSETVMNETNLLSSEVKNLKSVRKKLSLTILELDDRTYQIFLSSRAVYLVCFDLTHELNGLAQTNFSYGFEKNGELTNLDYLDFIFKSIHFHTAKIPDSATLANATNTASFNSIQIEDEKVKINFKYSTLSPPIIIIGTNKNGLNGFPNKEEIIQQKFQRIKEFLVNKIYSNHIVEPYFAIDNMTVDADTISQQADPEIETLKRVIEMVSLNEPYMGEQLPLKWMKFEKSLEKLKNKGLFYASLSQICEIAHEKDIKTQEELTTCLNFLNDLGAIIYHGNANDIFLRNTIILRPQKLVEIFNMILDAKIPHSLSKMQNELLYNSNNYDGNNNNSRSKWLDAWDRYNKRGILNDSLLDLLWKGVINQKPGLLGLMKKFDLICDQNVTNNMKVTTTENLEREYLVPSRSKINYDEDSEEEMNILKSHGNNKKKKYLGGYNSDSDYDEYNSDNEIEDLNEKKKSMMNQVGGGVGSENNISIIEFYYDFCGFLPEALFHRIVTRIARWTLMKTGTDNMNAVRMYYRKARFYLDENHDFTIEMAPIKYARIKIQIIRISKMTHGYLSAESPPEPNSCAKVRNFMESTLIDLRNLWIKRLMFNACVLCSCDKPCDLHQFKMCTHFKCMHFLNLDECLTNNIVTCEYRRVKTLIYKSWFPTQNISLHKGPVLSATKSYSDKNMFYDEKTLPNWVKNIAKLLQVAGRDKEKDKDKENQVVTIHNKNDWVALARLLGYNKSKINYFTESEHPALQLICDWIMSSDNTNLTIEFLINYLEQLKREDVIKIINNEREKETVNSSVFLSYQWDFQEEVLKIKENLEKAGFKCFMDVGQMGGGNLLFQKIDQAIRNSKVVIACITPKFVVSHFCNREMALADLLRKPIVPIMLAPTPWPPPGGMGLIFSQLVYVDYFGVGGHGGMGKNADRDQRNNEIVALVARHVDPSSYFLMNIDRITDNENAKRGKLKKSFLNSLIPLRATTYSNNNNNNNNQGFIDEVNTNNANAGSNRTGALRSNNQTRLSTIESFQIRTGVNGFGGGADSNVGENQNQADVPKCAVCTLL